MKNQFEKLDELIKKNGEELRKQLLKMDIILDGMLDESEKALKKLNK